MKPSRSLLEAIYAAAYVENLVKMEKLYPRAEAVGLAMSAGFNAVEDFSEVASRRTDLLPEVLR